MNPSARASRWGWVAGAAFALAAVLAVAGLIAQPRFDDYRALAFIAGVGLLAAFGAAALIRRTAEREVERHETAAADSRAATLATANKILSAAMESSPDGILAVDDKERIIAYNRRFAEMWGLPETLVDARRDPAVLANVAAQSKDPGVFLARVDYLYRHPEIASHEAVELKDGRIFDRHSTTLYDDARRYLGRIWFFRDITEARRAEERASRLAREDALTGLANRRAFVEAAGQAIARAGRGAPGFAVLYLDLDRFKDVNDTYGHPAGDMLLVEVGTRLRASVRTTDLAARFGGDEFAVLQSDVSEVSASAILARKLIAALAAPYRVNGHETSIGVSVGVALFGPDAAEPEAIIAHADMALYRAKAEGRGTFRFFTDKLNSDVSATFGLAERLRRAISEGRVEFDFQPQVMTGSRALAGVEALARWTDEPRGAVAPDEFVAAAEKSGLAGTFGHFVLLSACRQLSEWLDSGIAPPTLWVNVSALQCKAPVELEREVEAALAATRVPPSRLGLEVHEEGLAEILRDHSDVLRRLKARGVKIAIEEFGTGYSSLERLRRVPVDEIKIGRDYVARIATDPDEAMIVRAAIALARVLDIGVVALGVETDAQAALLQSWGCERIQGFLVARPMSAAALKPWLERRAPEAKS